MESVKTAIQRAKARAALDGQVVPYSLRHTAARWMRLQGVPMHEVGQQLGRKRADVTTTLIYTAYDPAYLQHSVKALDKLVRAVCVRESGAA